MILRKRRTRPEGLFGPQPDHRSCETIFFEVKDSAPNPEEAYDLRQRQTKILRAIRRLDPKPQAALRMQIKHEWSVKEISQALKISEAAAKSRLYRARQQLSTKKADYRRVAIHHMQSLSASGARDTLLSPSAKASIENLIHD
jgi:RNA polymerase sigma-70 factor (ECF subfamily)